MHRKQNTNLIPADTELERTLRSLRKTKRTENSATADERGDLTEEAKVWFYFLASVLVPTKHVCTVREQEAVLLYAILKGYKLKAGAIIENSIMKYHEGNKRGLIPHPATITWLCLKAGVKGSWAEEEECPNASPLTLTGESKGPRNLKKKGVMVETESKNEEENAGQEEDNLMVDNQEEQIPKT